MSKFPSLIFLCVCSSYFPYTSGRSGGFGILGGLLKPLQEIVKPLNRVLRPVANALNDVQVVGDVIRVVADGIAVSMPLTGDTLHIGAVALPFDILCNSPLSASTCRTCMLDCVYAHNATSGQCAPDPNSPDLATCLCDYTPTNPLPIVNDICPDSYESNVLQIPQVDTLIDGAIVEILRIRYGLLLCGGERAGCDVDCGSNHGANSGYCSAGLLIRDLGSFVNGFCLCTYANGADGNVTQPQITF